MKENNKSCTFSQVNITNFLNFIYFMYMYIYRIKIKSVITKDSNKKKRNIAGVYFKTFRNMAKQISIFQSAE